MRIMIAYSPASAKYSPERYVCINNVDGIFYNFGGNVLIEIISFGEVR